MLGPNVICPNAKCIGIIIIHYNFIYIYNMDNYYHKYIKYKSKYLHIKGGKRKKQSPSISATNFKIGTVQTGNDGNEWIVTKDKRGVRKWKVYKRIKRQNIGKITFDNYIS